jgi:CRP-like cAMP-binding protein
VWLKKRPLRDFDQELLQFRRAPQQEELAKFAMQQVFQALWPKEEAARAGCISSGATVFQGTRLLFPDVQHQIQGVYLIYTDRVFDTVTNYMEAFADPQRNRLLTALPRAELERIEPHLQYVAMPLGTVLYESGDVLRHVYFPTDSIVSLLYVTADGASAEIAVVGNEGVVGISLLMGGETTLSRAIVQSGGYAFRLLAKQLKDEFHRNGALQILLLRYTQALITQMALTAVCNRHHTLEQQLCRWLLLSLDRLDSNRLKMTQGLIADMLGVRREGVSESAGKLQRLGVISYNRGQITVLDRQKLRPLSTMFYVRWNAYPCEKM